jgi:hypothetical protein
MTAREAAELENLVEIVYSGTPAHQEIWAV